MSKFYIESSQMHKGDFVIRYAEDVYKETYKDAPMRISYTVLPARLLGMDYHTYLQFVRQEFDAVLHGKQGKYIYCTFKDKGKVQVLSNLLNIKWKELLKTK